METLKASTNNKSTKFMVAMPGTNAVNGALKILACALFLLGRMKLYSRAKVLNSPVEDDSYKTLIKGF